MQSCRDQRRASEKHVDSHKKSQCPGGSPRKPENNDTCQENIHDAACEHECPASGKLTSMFDGEHDRCAAFDEEEQNQNHSERAGDPKWPSHKTAIKIL